MSTKGSVQPDGPPCTVESQFLEFVVTPPGADALGDEQLVKLDPAQLGDVQPLQLFALLR